MTLVESRPLSPMQRSMWFHALSAPGSGVDVQQIRITLTESVDLPLFTRAWEQLVQRHAILRTGFRWEGLPAPAQFVADAVSLPVTIHDWQAHPAARRNNDLARFAAADRRRDFDLRHPPLLRLNLFRCGPDETICLWTFHHILIDGRSFPILLEELFSIYDGLRSSTPPALPTRRPFADYLAWMANRDLTAAASFWQEALAGFGAPTPLPGTERRDPPPVARATAQRTTRLPEAATGRLATFAAAADVTVNTTVQAAWGLLLHHHSREKDVVFGATRACRYGLEGLKEMVGLFINTLPIRARLTADTPLRDYLHTLRRQQVAMRPHEHTPLPQVQKWSDVRDGSPLFHSLVVFEGYDLDATMRRRGGESMATRHFHYQGQTNFPLTLMAYHDGNLTLRLEYDPDLFAADAVDALLSQLLTLLSHMPDHAAAPALALPLLDADALATITRFGRGPRVPVDAGETLVGRFEAQVAATPEAIAVESGREQLTYAALNQRANRLARLLRRRGITPNQFVGVYLPRSLDLLTALMGVVKAGAAYLPLDPVYPPGRLATMLDDAGAPLVITHSSMGADVAGAGADVLTLDQSGAALAAESPANLDRKPADDDLIYTIYTSGSTGRPKGVLLRHGNVLNLLAGLLRDPGLAPGETVLAVTTVSFDVSVPELFLPLLAGARVVIATQAEINDGETLARLIDTSSTSLMMATPALWQHLLNSGWQGSGKLRLISTGEALPRPLANQLHPRCRELLNYYGPTEITVWATGCPVDPGDGPILIGRPFANTSAYILSEHGNRLPVGAVGELYIGGAGVAAGYHNRPELTAARFLPDPFDDDPDARIYRTGDLARFRPDGQIECLGRVDFQVKIRGFRIETGEIETVLAGHGAVNAAVVVPWTSPRGDRQLVAYLVPGAGRVPAVSELRKHCQTRLPEYMVPAAFVPLDAFPLTGSGKVDRNALPTPDQDRPVLDNPFIPPATPTEQTIAAIWRELLLVERIGVDDSFFELGGDSLLVVGALQALRRRLDADIGVHDLFALRTIRTLAARLDQGADTPPADADDTSRRAARQRAARRQRRRPTRLREEL